jgi:hypothetical protein
MLFDAALFCKLRNLSFSRRPGIQPRRKSFGYQRALAPEESFLFSFSCSSAPTKRPQTEVCATAPLALPGALPFSACADEVSGLSSRPFACANRPAIVQLTRQDNYTARFANLDDWNADQ